MVVANQFVPVARVAYDESTSRVIAIFANALPPEGRDYQLWALGPNAPSGPVISVGLRG